MRCAPSRLIPVYNYDPERLPTFGQRDHGELSIPAGPNNPVGAVWIALTLDTYGIHGTPDPSKISKTQSHGCVRLTNWDATELGRAVRQGVPVRFVQQRQAASNAVRARRLKTMSFSPCGRRWIGRVAVETDEGCLLKFCEVARAPFTRRCAPPSPTRGEGLLLSPAAYAPGIDVHKVRSSIIANAAALGRDRRIANARGIDARDANIDGAAIHVQAARGDAIRLLMQRRIARGRAVTGNNLIGLRAANGAVQIGKLIEQSRIDGVNFIAAVIAKDAVDFGERLRCIRAALKVRATERLARMRVDEGQSPRRVSMAWRRQIEQSMRRLMTVVTAAAPANFKSTRLSMVNSVSHARVHNKAIGHLRFKTTKAEQAKGNKVAFLACGALALLAGFNFTAQEISNRFTAARAPHAAPAASHTPAQVNPSFSIFAAPRQLRIPVDGVSPNALSDTWGQARSEGRQHQGTDIMAPMGTPIRAIADGRITRFFDSQRGGITIYQSDAAGRYIFYYAHLQKRAGGLAEGQSVRQGQLLGYVGATGNATTPHLHFEIQRMAENGNWWQSEAVNPYPYLLSGEAPR